MKCWGVCPDIVQLCEINTDDHKFCEYVICAHMLKNAVFVVNLKTSSNILKRKFNMCSIVPIYQFFTTYIFIITDLEISACQYLRYKYSNVCGYIPRIMHYLIHHFFW